MKASIQDALYGLGMAMVGSGLAILVMLPYITTERNTSRLHGYNAGLKAGMLYADELLAEGWECVSSAYLSGGAQQIGIVCTLNTSTIIIAEKARGIK